MNLKEIAYSKGKVFAWLALTVGLGNSAFWTIFPLVIDSNLKSETLVGLFFTLIAVIGFIVSLLSPLILKKVSRVYLTQISMLSIVGLLILFTFASSVLHFYFIESFRSIFSLLVGIMLALYVRDSTVEKKLGAAEGRFYLFANIGWFIGPLIGGFLGDNVSRNSVFIFTAILYLISFIIFQYTYRTKHEFLKRTKEEKAFAKIVKKNFIEFFKTKEMWKVFAVGTGLSFWWVIHEIFFPIYIVSIGFTDTTVGIVLAAGVLPLIVLEKIIGKKADKYGMRPFITIGFLIMAFITIMFNIIPNVTTVLVLMAIVNTGAAFIEPLQDTYLFKAARKEDEERFYAINRISYPIANVFGPLIAAGLIFIGGFSGLWYGAAAIILAFALISSRIKI